MNKKSKTTWIKKIKKLVIENEGETNDNWFSPDISQTKAKVKEEIIKTKKKRKINKNKPLAFSWTLKDAETNGKTE